jgi:hypothetical protein
MSIQPVPGGALQLPTPATANFVEYYNDATNDEHHLQYANVMAVFRSIPGGSTPAQIRELVANNPRETSLGYAVLVIPPNNPAHQGEIYGLHCVSKFGMRLGQPVTQWDNRIFGAVNDVMGHQVPTTVELPADAFVRQNGGAMFRVGLSQRMDASFGADPDLQLLGPFANFDAGTELLESRNMVPIPHRYMRCQPVDAATSLGDGGARNHHE